MIIQLLALFKVKLHPRAILRRLSCGILLGSLLPYLLQLVLPVQQVIPPPLNLVATLSLRIERILECSLRLDSLLNGTTM